MSTSTPPMAQTADLLDAYQDAFDALGQAYWDASDLPSKDLLHGTQAAIGNILSALDQDQLAGNTDAFLAILPKVKAVNDALKEIQESISRITKNIDTAASVMTTASKILSLLPL